MSNAVTNACSRYVASLAQKTMLMCLANRANDEGFCWPSLPYLCEWTCLSRTAAIDAMKHLESAGAIAVTRTSGKVNRITILTANIVNQSASRTGAPAERVRAPNGSTANVAVTKVSVPKRSSTTKAKPKPTLLPENFAVSPAVRQWAVGKGFDAHLDAHLEQFTGSAKASARVYADWDQAFMNAIRDDWGGVRKSRSARQPTPAASGRHSGFEKMDYLEGVGADGSLL